MFIKTKVQNVFLKERKIYRNHSLFIGQGFQLGKRKEMLGNMTDHHTEWGGKYER